MKMFTGGMAAVLLLLSQAQVQAQDEQKKDQVKKKIMELVEKRLREQDEKILAEVRATLAKELGKDKPDEKPAKKTEEKKKGYLGISVDEVDEDTRKELGLDEGVGVIVTHVQADSGAEKAGLEVDDVVISVDGKNVSDLDQLRSAVTSKKEGDALEVTIVREKDTKKIKVVLGAWPEENE